MIGEPSTPLMRQYQSVKQQINGALLLFRLGDFYELFYDDAVTAARELEITLTSRNKERASRFQCVASHFMRLTGYIARLVQKGFRVAICEQMEEPGPGKKLVRRELTRIVTPGTATEPSLLRSHENNFLAAVFTKGDRSGLAYADVSTGEFRTTELPASEVVPTLETLNVREVIHPEDRPAGSNSLETPVSAWVFGADYAGRQVLEHFRLLSLEGCGLGESSWQRLLPEPCCTICVKHSVLPSTI